ncbi:tripartite tricarboxylate transporter substrate binding protein [Limnohabitans sp.]|uniref:Bug family tripartite tricarboxylate transporter substrate binding protein n=1 Tax=Limnohabitans sp. TaxID=1907725 RepID=UPI002AFFA7FE|nr:tripartite tricarboxylate transporter substrate binding protein [Limnohabitans sp.]
MCPSSTNKQETKVIQKITSALRIRSLQFAAIAVVSVSPWSSTLANDFPKQAVEMTVLFGGSSATIAQVLADGMSKQLKVPVAAVSRTGGGGAAGYSFVKSSPPNGYNIVWNSNSINTTFHGGNIPFDYRSFDPVAQAGMEVPALAVRSDSGWKTLADVAAAGKKQKLKVGISGRGSFTHLASASLFKKMGIEVIYVPYGTGSAPVELLGGRVDAALQWPSQFTAMADKIHIVAVTSDKRVPLVPHVPTAKEQGFDVNMVMWRGIAVPAGTPKEVIARLQNAIQVTVESTEFKIQSAKLGFEPEYLPSAAFGKVVAEDDAEYAKLMTELGLKK